MRKVFVLKKILLSTLIFCLGYSSEIKNNPADHYFELGKKYYHEKEIQKAIQYFELSWEYGNDKAQYNLATIYAQNKHYKKAFPLFLSLAKQNNPKAQNMVGVFLLNGLGVQKDYKKALHWFEQAFFENNYTPAVCNLSFMFANGYGASFNFGRASILARIGMKHDLPRCKKVYEEYNLQKYTKDRGWLNFGYYKNLDSLE